MHRSAAFTLIELLVTLAIIALLSTLFVSAANGFFNQRKERPERDFITAVTTARNLAVETGAPAFLHLIDGGKTGEIVYGKHQKTFSLNGATARLLPAEEGGTVLIGGIARTIDELPFVRFYSDGGCDAFRVEINPDNAIPLTLRFDPWTCAVLRPAKP